MTVFVRTRENACIVDIACCHCSVSLSLCETVSITRNAIYKARYLWNEKTLIEQQINPFTIIAIGVTERFLNDN